MENNDFQSMLSGFMKNAKQMQENFSTRYKELAENHAHRTVKGQAGGELVIVEVNLKLQVTKIDCQPELFQEQPLVIGQLIQAAVNQALHEAQQLLKTEMANLGQQMGLPPDLSASLGALK